MGIVHPVAGFSLTNQPSNEKLLSALAKDFLDHKFDIRHIERTILLSHTYQLTSKQLTRRIGFRSAIISRTATSARCWPKSPSMCSTKLWESAKTSAPALP